MRRYASAKKRSSPRSLSGLLLSKVRVVQEDPTERGVRAILNFGHTLGHALEAATMYAQYSHGEAVAVGMALVAILSERLGFCSAAVRSRLCALIEALGLPTTYTDLPPQRLLEVMTHDKKSLNGVVRFVLLKDIGEVALSSTGASRGVADAPR